MVMLLQTPAQPGSGSVRILIAVGLLILVVLAFGLFALRLRRRLLADDSSGPTGQLLLDDLRQMLKRGEITQAEYDAMRQRMAARMSARSGTRLSGSGARPAASITPTAGERSVPGIGRRDLAGDPLPDPKAGE